MTSTAPLFRTGVDPARFPATRYMGSKLRVLPLLQEVFESISFETALDAFSGSGCVAYLLKRMGKQVTANDFLNFNFEIARATIANAETIVTREVAAKLARPNRSAGTFVRDTFRGLYFAEEDNAFLDHVWANLEEVEDAFVRSIAIAALCRACMKRRPRGAFTVTGMRYDDGRRDLQLSLREHFLESIDAYNEVVFDNGQANVALRGDVFDIPDGAYDLVYLDPPYVPLRDDNCYIKRYHFVEGLSCYWRGVEIRHDTTTKKLRKRFTPFSYKRTIVDALRRLFEKFRRSMIVLSYSTNSYPPREVIHDLLAAHKQSVTVYARRHRYSFGTHGRVSEAKKETTELVFVGT